MRMGVCLGRAHVLFRFVFELLLFVASSLFVQPQLCGNILRHAKQIGTRTFMIARGRLLARAFAGALLTMRCLRLLTIVRLRRFMIMSVRVVACVLCTTSLARGDDFRWTLRVCPFLVAQTRSCFERLPAA